MFSPALLSVCLLAAPQPNTRPFDGADYALGGLSALIGAATGGIVGGLAGAAWADDSSDGFAQLGMMLLGGILGLAPGAAGGVTAYGALRNAEGSVGWAWGGAALGLAAGFGALSLSQSEMMLFPALLGGPSLGAVLGYGLGADARLISLGLGEVDGHSTLLLLGRF
ncbi:hypothetical protein KKF91_01875 [Myxococcota bacterium]|nr:hypothetical protein [Myxococcota bacterium]MBU1429285.1 hypothetical protein [Myxococcota bacterium]